MRGSSMTLPHMPRYTILRDPVSGVLENSNPLAIQRTSETKKSNLSSIDLQEKEIEINMRKRKALEGLEHVSSHKRRLLNHYYQETQMRLEKQRHALKQKAQEQLISSLQKRKQEIQKLVEITYSVSGVRRNEGKLVVKINRTYNCHDHDKLKKLLGKKLETPPLPEPKPQRRRKQHEHETRVEDIAVTIQWGLTADEIREDLSKIFPHRKFGRIIETQGFLNAPSKMNNRTKRKQFRR